MQEINRILGQLNGKIDMLVDEWHGDRERKHETMKRLERIELKQEEAAKDRRHLHKRSDVVEAKVQEFSRWQERGKGAAAIISVIAAAVGGAVAAAWGHVHKFFS